jgi:hypothetical protein
MLYLISLFMLALAFLVHKKNFDIFTDRGSIRKLVNKKIFNMIALTLVLSQFFFSSIIFYIFWSFFGSEPAIDYVLLAGAMSVILYATSFIICKSYGPYLMFRFAKKNENRYKDVLMAAVWLLGVSLIEGAIFNFVYPIGLLYSTFTAAFAITVIGFLAT